MKKTNTFLTFLCILFVGCSNKPSETEYYALKEANDAFESFRLKGYSDLVNNLYEKNSAQAQDPTEEVKIILDGAIIKSEMGKTIRANIQESLVLFALFHKQSSKHIEEMKELVRSATTTQELKELLETSLENLKNDKIFNGLSDKIELLKEDRLKMLSKMRAELEK
ncbi:MAG: hypothetical protein PHO37_13105 [Kiritimatiellae bacterium]|nr:hypothetical protein [Kiritimatiellia bacterium]